MELLNPAIYPNDAHVCSMMEPFSGGIEIPPAIPHHGIPLIGAGLVRMGGMGGIF